MMGVQSVTLAGGRNDLQLLGNLVGEHIDPLCALRADRSWGTLPAASSRSGRQFRREAETERKVEEVDLIGRDGQI